MTDELCKPSNYGLCRRCAGQVTLVIMDDGARKLQEDVDCVHLDCERGIQWMCEKCMQKNNSHAAKWKPDELTKVVLAGADPLLANTFAEIQSLITQVFGGTHARQTM